ncbi:hypothetical protein TNCV_4762221 [Trichonephila clavipes]|nr:hypothetical protein TNCV_4762221 [Trichonephila clavipes]
MTGRLRELHQTWSEKNRRMPCGMAIVAGTTLVRVIVRRDLYIPPNFAGEYPGGGQVPSTIFLRGRLARLIFRVPPCLISTIHLQPSIPALEFEFGS